MHRVDISAAREAIGYSVDDLLNLCSHCRRLYKDRTGCRCRLRRAQAHRRCTPSANLHDPPSLATSGFAIPSDTTRKAPKSGQVTSR